MGIKDEIAFIRENDPAASSDLEVLLCYPGLHAILMHRVAHSLHVRGFKLPARILSQFARLVTGIEIHPGAKIADRVFIDHGLGVVIGETTIIEEEVIIYQGCTLGGTTASQGKRHPTVKRGAVIGAHAQVLGDITIGAHSRIGSGSVTVKDVRSETTVVGVPSRESGRGKSDKLSHQNIPDVSIERIERLEQELKELKNRS